jgi:uncharacterized protein (TIGR01777 family)
MEVPMRVIITGGSGLIGPALVRSLVRDGQEVILLSRSPERQPAPAGARYERWDGRTAEGWGHLADGAQAIVNLAGENLAGKGVLRILFAHWTAARKRSIRQSRIDTGRAIVDAVQRAARKPEVVIQSSAVGYYGVTHDDRRGEADAPGADFLASVCVDWETSTAPVETMGVRRAITRSGVVLAPTGVGILWMLLLPFRLFAGGRLGSGRQWFPWVHLDDEVGAIRFLIDQPQARGPFNLTAPHQLRNAEAAEIIARVVRRPAWFPVPSLALRMLLGEKGTLVLEGQLAPPDRLLSQGFVFQHPQFEGALRDLLA